MAVTDSGKRWMVSKMLFTGRDMLFWLMAGQYGIAQEIALILADTELNGE